MCDYKLVGSAGDGFGFYASEGSNKFPGSARATLTQDIDINIFINTLPIEKRHLKPVAGALGFTWLSLPAHEVCLLGITFYFHLGGRLWKGTTVNTLNASTFVHAILVDEGYAFNQNHLVTS